MKKQEQDYIPKKDQIAVNVIALIGRVHSIPRVVINPDYSYASFMLYVPAMTASRRLFINCYVFDQKVDIVKKYMYKNQLIAIVGTLSSKFIPNEGRGKIKGRFAYYIACETIQFLDYKMNNISQAEGLFGAEYAFTKNIKKRGDVYQAEPTSIFDRKNNK